MAKDPKLPFISALVMAGDLLSVDRSLQWLREGKYVVRHGRGFRRVLRTARLPSQGARPKDSSQMSVALTDLPGCGRGSDPDDTDPRFLDLWKRARIANGGSYLRDGKALPRRRILQVYRGQDEGAPFGIAWSLDWPPPSSLRTGQQPVAHRGWRGVPRTRRTSGHHGLHDRTRRSRGHHRPGPAWAHGEAVICLVASFAGAVVGLVVVYWLIQMRRP